MYDYLPYNHNIYYNIKAYEMPICETFQHEIATFRLKLGNTSAFA